jgi:hypothetical protein
MPQLIRRDIDKTTVLIDELGVRIRDVLSKYKYAIELQKETPGFINKARDDLVDESRCRHGHILQQEASGSMGRNKPNC